MEENTSRAWEFLVALVAVGLGIAAWVLSNEFPRTDEGYLGPALFPKILGFVLVVSGLALAWPNLRRSGLGQAFRAEAGMHLWPMLLVLVVLAFTPWLISKVGLLATAVGVAVLAAFLLEARWKQVVVMAVIFGAFIYLVFGVLLRVTL